MAALKKSRRDCGVKAKSCIASSRRAGGALSLGTNGLASRSEVTPAYS
jgi:hypothetical protein